MHFNENLDGITQSCLGEESLEQLNTDLNTTSNARTTLDAQCAKDAPSTLLVLMFKAAV